MLFLVCPCFSILLNSIENIFWRFLWLSILSTWPRQLNRLVWFESFPCYSCSFKYWVTHNWWEFKDDCTEIKCPFPFIQWLNKTVILFFSLSKSLESSYYLIFRKLYRLLLVRYVYTGLFVEDKLSLTDFLLVNRNSIRNDARSAPKIFFS